MNAPKRNHHLVWLGLSSLLASLALLFFFAPDQYSFYPRCLFHSLTGWQCPGCGGLRATHCLLHGKLAAAFHFNPLFVALLPVLCVAGLVRVLKRDWLEHFRWPFWLWLLLATAVVFGVGRNLWNL